NTFSAARFCFSRTAGMAIGTPHYVSPEQARGQEDIDIRSDIYSLGATFYHMVTGRAPFEGNSAAVVMTKHLTEDLVSPQHVNPDVSQNVCRVIQKMMAKDVEDRYATPAELGEDIERILKGKMPLAKVAGITKRPGKKKRLVDTDRADAISLKRELARREKKGLSRAVIGGIAAGGVAVLVLLFLLLRNGEEPSDPARPGPSAGVTVDRGVRDNEIEEMLNSASKWEEQHPDDYEGSVAKYERVSREGSGTVWEMRARDAAQAVREKQKRAAEKVFDDLADRAEKLANNGDYDGAIAVFKKLPKKFEKIMKPFAAEAMDALKIDASTNINNALAAAEKLFKEDRPERGIAELESVASTKYAPLAVKITSVRSRLLRKKKDVEEMARREAVESARKKLREHWAQFDRKAIAGDIVGAKAVLAAAGKDEILGRAGDAIKAGEVLDALEGMLKGFSEISGGGDLEQALSRLVGTSVELETIGGEKSGTVKSIVGEIIHLEVKSESAFTTERVRFSNLTEKQKAMLVSPPKPKTPAGWLALAAISIGKKDVKTAQKAIRYVVGGPLVSHYRDEIEALRTRETEAAAKKFWEWRLEPLLAAGKLTKGTGEIARQRVYDFRKEHGRTAFARKIEGRLASLEKMVAEVLPYAFDADPESEKKTTALAVVKGYSASWQKLDPTWTDKPSKPLRSLFHGGVGAFHDPDRNLCIMYALKQDIRLVSDAAWAYDSGKNTLSRFSSRKGNASGAAPKAGKKCGAVYDPKRACYFVSEGTTLWAFDSKRRIWKEYLESKQYMSYLGRVSGRDCLVEMEFLFRRACRIDLSARKVEMLKNPPLAFRDGVAGGHLASHDSRGRFLFFGGTGTGSGGKIMGDTWLYDPASDTWTLIECAEPPPPRAGAFLDYNPRLGVWILAGGRGAIGPLKDMWAYDDSRKTWIEIVVATGPDLRGGFCYDQANDRHVLFCPEVSPPQTWVCRITPKK
ncbi:kelch repeat-containing protein, partial [Planctomycetota bacterium]